MVSIYYAKRKGTSKEFSAFVLKTRYALQDVSFFRASSGKPYCNAPVSFSLSHTDELFFLAVISEKNKEIGIDAEALTRRGNFNAVLKRFPQREREFGMRSAEDFLSLWTKTESAAKYLSRPVYAVLPRLRHIGAKSVCLDGTPLPVKIETFIKSGHVVSLCLPKEESVGTIEEIIY